MPRTFCKWINWQLVGQGAPERLKAMCSRERKVCFSLRLAKVPTLCYKRSVGTFFADVSLLNKGALFCAALEIASDYMLRLQLPSL